ncbi:hypothetical protein CN918_31705 [Priestia megaterium]|nr:hypothetical protein CN918_31705 [Priestia megaterium]
MIAAWQKGVNSFYQQTLASAINVEKTLKKKLTNIYIEELSIYFSESLVYLKWKVEREGKTHTFLTRNFQLQDEATDHTFFQQIVDVISFDKEEEELWLETESAKWALSYSEAVEKEVEHNNQQKVGMKIVSVEQGKSKSPIYILEDGTRLIHKK